MTTGFGEEPTEDEYAFKLDVRGFYDRGLSVDDGVSVRQEAGFSVEWTPTEESEPAPAPTEPEPVDTTPTWDEPPASSWEEPTPSWEQQSPSSWGTDLA